MPKDRAPFLLAVFAAVALHALFLAWAGYFPFQSSVNPDTPKSKEAVLFMEVVAPPPNPLPPQPVRPTQAPKPNPAPVLPDPPNNAVTAPDAAQPPASMDAPAAPTAEEWAFAAKYTLQNSKGYRHNWAKQVRSLMGTAVEGPDQGMVRFRVEIAPDGKLAQLDTLWTTSPVAEQVARKAMAQMPPLPPTPNGKPLIFEKTISFSPFIFDSPPLYKDDCLPDPPTFGNPFAWDGKSPQVRLETRTAEPQSAQDLEQCLKQLPQDSIEAESASDQRQLEQWGSSRLGR